MVVQGLEYFLSYRFFTGSDSTEKPEGVIVEDLEKETSVWGAFVKGNANLPILALVLSIFSSS